MSKRISQYRYNVGDIIQTDKIHYEVLQQTRIGKPKYNTSVKAYRVRCRKCGYKQEYSQAQILSGYGCGVCNGKIIVHGINSIQDLAPWMVDWLNDPQDAYRYAPTSNVYIEAKCHDCGYTKKIRLSNLHYRHGFKCPICGDGKSFPQRFMTNLFLMNNVDFISQLSSKNFSWVGKKRYDFYLPQYNSIVQAHGIHHYKEMKDFTISGEKQRIRDHKKEKLALQNGISPYIVIDFSNDEITHIKRNITQSGLLDLIGLSPDNIDWEQIYRRSAQTIIKKVCDYYERTRDSHFNIGKKFGINHITVGRYLRKGAKLGWTTFVVGQRSGKQGLELKYEARDPNGTIICHAQSAQEIKNVISQKYLISISVSSIYRVVNGETDNVRGFKFSRIDKGEMDHEKVLHDKLADYD